MGVYRGICICIQGYIIWYTGVYAYIGVYRISGYTVSMQGSGYRGIPDIGISVYVHTHLLVGG